MPQRATFQIPSRREDASRFTEAFEAFCVEHGVAMGVVRAFQVCLDEVLTNIVDYAHQADGAHTIEVQVTLDAELLRTEVIDDGPAFDPLQDAASPDLDLSIEDRPIGGLGIHLVQELMDEVAYQRGDDGRNHFSMGKRLSPNHS